MQITIPPAASACAAQLDAALKPSQWVGDAANLAQARLQASRTDAHTACAQAGWAISALVHAQARAVTHGIVLP